MGSKSGQVTIFIIIGVVLVSSVILFFMFRDNLFTENIPASIDPVYTSFLSCLTEEVYVGIDLLETQAGYIDLPDFEPGSEYMPFSNQLNFLGNPIPYWYYVSRNNIPKEQVPTKSEMAKDLGNFVEERIIECEFSSYSEQGFEINFGKASLSDVRISDNNVEISLVMNLNIIKGEDSVLIKNHNVVVESKLGKLYDSAKKIYEKEQRDLFLEEYAVDTLRLYAPVDGVELTCSPKIWNAENIFDDLQEAIEANTLALKTKGGDYSINSKEDEYFVIDLDISEDVRFLNSMNWANAYEVNPSEGSMLISKPVGNQPGLGVLGFCYVPYHFVYNVKYPVLIQVSSGNTLKGTNEIFQFPVAVVLQGNNPREALNADAVEIGIPELCKYKNNKVEVNIYDANLNSVDAEISYECFGSTCNIGSTEEGSLSSEFPQCVNGYILVRAEGYEDSKYLFSTTEEGSVDIILEKVYELEVDLKLDNIHYSKQAIISFISEKNSKTIVYPEQKTIELSEGQYEMQVFIYKNSTLRLDATIHEQCIEAPSEGIGGLFGVTSEKCFQIEIPAQVISNALAGGGSENYYILEDELKLGSIEINVDSLATPSSIEELQNNYIVVETKGLDIMFK